MADNFKGDNEGNVYVEYDYDNIIIVDPNRLQDSQGRITERLVDHENLVMFINLEAELLPRTKLAVGGTPDNIRTISIAKINFLKPGDADFLTTGYYDELTGEKTTLGKGVNQSVKEYVPSRNGQRAYSKLTNTVDGKFATLDNDLLGITNVNIKISGSFIPTVDIQMEDVQGRGLFQLGENSPYAAFFHLPYPPFYLTLKGYYGKAIKYQLNLHEFSASFNSMSGNYQVRLKFYGYKYNILNEIQMGHLIAAPHMYSARFDVSASNAQAPSSGTLQNTVNQQSGQVVTQSNSQNTVTKQIYVEKGYQKIIEVYGEYKALGLLDKDFPELTLQQLMNKLENFEKNILESYPKSDVEPLTNIREYQSKLKTLLEIVYTDPTSWFNTYLNNKPFIEKDTFRRFYAYKETVDDSRKPEALTKLEGIIKEYNDVLNANPTLGTNGTNPIKNNINIKNITATTTSDKIDWVKTTTEQKGIPNPTIVQVNELILSYDKLFTPASIGSFRTLLSGIGGSDTPFITDVNKKNLPEFLKPYFFIFEGFEKFYDTIIQMNAEAAKKLSEIEAKLTKSLSDKIQDPKLGIGFKPTVRNIIGVIMASTEGFIRLLDDVHTQSWNLKSDPIRKSAILNPTSTSFGSDTKNVTSGIGNDPNNSNGEIPVYPWPQYFEEQVGDDKKGTYQLKYIGDPLVSKNTKGYLYDKWPEVEFVEEYIRGLTKKFNTPNTPTPSEVSQFTNLLNINAIEFPQSDITYQNKEEIKFLFEIWERQFLTCRYTNLNRFKRTDSSYNELIKLIIDVETKNLLNTLTESNPFLLAKLKNYNINSANYLDILKSETNNGTTDSYKKYISDIFVTPYIETYTKNSFGVLNNTDIGKEPVTKIDLKVLENLVKSTQTNELRIIDTYPFTNTNWLTKNVCDGDTISNAENAFDTSKSLKVYTSRNQISNFIDLNDFSTNRPVTNFSYENVKNPLDNSSSYVNTFNDSFIKDFYRNRTPENFLPTEGYCYFNVPNNATLPILTLPSSQLPVKTTTSLINTPFFVNSILDGVTKEKQNGDYPYIAAGYLFLNSLPLITLREKIKTNGQVSNDLNYMFATLKKFGAIHKLPYAWILKMGSVWHRYKQSLNGVDILTNVWKDADYKKLYDPITNNPQKKYNVSINSQPKTIQLEYSDSSIIKVQSGFFPKLISDFNFFYNGVDLYGNYTDTEIQDSIDNKLKLYNFASSNLNVSQNNIPLDYFTWSVMTKSNNDNYIMIPSFGSGQNQVKDSLIVENSIVPFSVSFSVRPGFSITGNTSVYNGAMRTLWVAPNWGYFDTSQINLPPTNSYLAKVVSNPQEMSPFSLLNSNEYSTMEEITSVFEKSILDNFEDEFLNFCRASRNLSLKSSSQLKFNQQLGTDDLKFQNFQLLFTEINTIQKPQPSETDETYFNSSLNSQLNSFSNNVLKFLQYDVLFKFGNPSSYNRFFFDSFIMYETNIVKSLVIPTDFGAYVANSLPPQTTLQNSKNTFPNEWKLLQQYVGFSSIDELRYKDSGSFITDFFIDNNVEFNQNNIINLAQIIKIYATQKLKNQSITSIDFKNSLNDYFNTSDLFQGDILDAVMANLRKDLPNYQAVLEATTESVVDGSQSKVDLYEAFKALNDKWIAGNDYTNETFFQDILFLDRASRNIGDTLLIDIFELKNTLNRESLSYQMNDSVYRFIASILIRNKFVVMNLPAYVNYYNVQTIDGVSRPTEQSPLKFADDMWGTFLNVDYRDSKQKMVCFFTGRPASYVDLDESKNFLFRSDGIQLEKNGAGNSLRNTPKEGEYALSNRVAGFTVDLGIRNQNVFNTFSVSQDNGRATAESVSTLMNMINQASARESATQNVSLYNYYSHRSYEATVTCLGNALIQPTMYFNLRHVPMFNGPYLITSVSHQISPGSFQTQFTGTRQGIFDLPTIDNYLQSINQNLLTQLETLILSKTDETPIVSTNTVSNSQNTPQTANNTLAPENSCQNKINSVYSTFTPATGRETVINESNFATLVKSVTTDGDLQAIIYSICYLRTYKSNGFRGLNNNFAMITLQDDYSPTFESFFTKEFCCANIEVAGGTQPIPVANFEDSKDFIGFMYSRLKDRRNQIVNDLGVAQFYLTLWVDKNQRVDATNYASSSLWNTTIERLSEGLKSAQKLGISITNFNKLLYGSNPSRGPITTSSTTTSSTSTTIPSTTARIQYLGEFDNLQGNDPSYYNILQTNGKFKVLRIIDPGFIVTNVGSTQFKDSSGNIVGNSCGAGSGSFTCTVNDKSVGTYTMNVVYYPNGMTDPLQINLISQPFTQ